MLFTFPYFNWSAHYSVNTKVKCLGLLSTFVSLLSPPKECGLCVSWSLPSPSPSGLQSPGINGRFPLEEPPCVLWPATSQTCRYLRLLLDLNVFWQSMLHIYFDLYVCHVPLHSITRWDDDGKRLFEFILLLIIFYFCCDIFVLRSSTKEANLMDSDSLKVWKHDYDKNVPAKCWMKYCPPD